jgi:uncharacterized glyoxalase superfamily protein PhnB
MTKKRSPAPKITQLTPILVVDRIEPALPFWEAQLGFAKVVEVPHEDRLGFVLLARDGAQVMLQTRESLAVDLPAVAALSPSSLLYVDVGSLAAAREAVAGARVIVPERKTFYGALELWVQDPSGQIIGFAEHHR